MLKRLGAELIGALPGGAVGIEANVGFEVVEERGVVFLLQVDDRQQTVDHRLLRGCRALLFRGRERIRDARETVRVPPVRRVLAMRWGSRRVPREGVPRRGEFLPAGSR